MHNNKKELEKTKIKFKNPVLQYGLIVILELAIFVKFQLFDKQIDSPQLANFVV